MAGDESDPSKEQAVQSLREGVNSLRAAVGHGEEYVSELTDRLPLSLRMVGAAIAGAILTQLHNYIAETVSQAAASIPSVLDLLGSIEVTLAEIIVWIFYLVLADIAITVVGINGLAIQVSSMNQEPVRSDGGKAVERPLIPRWTWVLFVVLHAGLGAFVGQSFGRLGMFVGLTVGIVIGDELYRRAKDGFFFGARFKP